MALIIGVDLGEYKSVACSHDTDTRAATYATLATDPAALRRLLESDRPGRPDARVRARVAATFLTHRTGAGVRGATSGPRGGGDRADRLVMKT